MRKTAINLMLFGLLGLVLGMNGFTILTWQFWIILSLVLGVQVNNSLK